MSVIDGATNTVTATVNVGSDPYGVAVDEATDTIYVANYGLEHGVGDRRGHQHGDRHRQLSARCPDGVAVDETTDTIYVTNDSVGHGVGDRRGHQHGDRHRRCRHRPLTVWRSMRPPTPSMSPTGVEHGVGDRRGHQHCDRHHHYRHHPRGVAVDETTDTIYAANKGRARCRWSSPSSINVSPTSGRPGKL